MFYDFGAVEFSTQKIMLAIVHLIGLFGVVPATKDRVGGSKHGRARVQYSGDASLSNGDGLQGRIRKKKGEGTGACDVE